MEPESGPQTTSPSPPKKSSRAWRIFRIVLIGAVASIALLLIFPPVGLIKDQIAKSAGKSLGRTVTIGDMRLRLLPKLEVDFDKVAVSNPPGMPERNLAQIETVKTAVDVLPLLKGRVRMHSLTLVKPQISLEEDASGVRNWVFVQQTQAAAAAPGADAEDEPAAAAASSFVPPPTTTIEDGTLSFQSAKSGTQRSVTAVNSMVTLDPVKGTMHSKGDLASSGETLTYDIALGDFDAAMAGKSSTLKASVDGRPIAATIDGDALFAAAAEFKGAITASTPSLIELAHWLGAELTVSGEPLKTSVAGKILATTRDVTFEETDVMVNTTSGRFDGVLDLGAVRPKLSGTVSSEHIDIQRIANVANRTSLVPESMPQADFEPTVTAGWEKLLDDLNTLERGPDVPESLEAVARPAAATWSEQPFNLNAIKAFDLDMMIKAAAISYGGLDLKNGRMKAAITDGLLDAKIEELSVGAGKATGTVNIDSRASPPRATLALILADVAAEPIVTEITGKPLLAGTSNVEINATAAGQNQSQLTTTLEGKARFSMGKGSLRGFDVRRMIFEWWKSWKFDLAMRTGFERLEAQYDIKKGILRSQPGFSMGGSEVEISSAGTVSVPNKRLNQEIRVKAIPPPTALPIPVRISGDWTKPSVGVDWGGLFGGVFGLGGPQAIARAPEAPPANVQAAIRRVLESNLPPDKLSPEGRQMLESLLPADGAP